MSRILLINPPTATNSIASRMEQYPNGALLLIGTILQNEKHEVKVVHMTADGIDLNKLHSLIKEYQPEVVGITAVTFQSKSLRETSRVIKETNKNIKVIAGGSHISALIDIGFDVLSDYPNIDYFVHGEGDNVIGNILSSRDNGKIITPAPVADINTPFINLNLINLKHFYGSYPLGRTPSMFIMGSRGCPFNCSFCSRAVFGKTVRYRNPLAIVEEAERMSTDWGIKEVFFHDDTFNLNRTWAEEILSLIIKRKLNQKLCFRTPCRVNKNLLDIDLLKLMRKAGFWLIFYGVESGNQRMLNSMRKGTTIEEVTRAFKLTREAGIKTEASFIIGLPGETLETINDSILLWKRINPDWCSFTRAIPFPASDLYKEAKQAGHLLFNSFDDIEINKTLCRTKALAAVSIEKHAMKLDRLMLRHKIAHILKHPYKYRQLLKVML